MADILVDQDNPYGNIKAVVEVSGGACYLYLVGAPETGFGTRSVWVRNLAAAPEALDVEGMRRGEAPLNPRAHTRDPRGARAPRASDLRVVWLPEGNGAALYERESPIAIIPPWSGIDGFHGYASACVGDGPVAWEMPRDQALLERFRDAERYWAAWDDEELWGRASDELIERIESALGPHSNYYAIDGGEWPPKALLRIPHRDAIVLVTVGVSLLPQPNVELSTDDWRAFRRIELGAVLPRRWPDDAIKRFGAYLSAQSRLPWRSYTWLGPTHTIPCDAWHDPRFTAALLLRDHPAAPRFQPGEQFGDPVRVVWFLAITEAERRLAMEQGSAALERQIPPDRWAHA